MNKRKLFTMAARDTRNKGTNRNLEPHEIEEELMDRELEAHGLLEDGMTLEDKKNYLRVIKESKDTAEIEEKNRAKRKKGVECTITSGDGDSETLSSSNQLNQKNVDNTEENLSNQNVKHDSEDNLKISSPKGGAIDDSTPDLDMFFVESSSKKSDLAECDRRSVASSEDDSVPLNNIVSVGDNCDSEVDKNEIEKDGDCQEIEKACDTSGNNTESLLWLDKGVVDNKIIARSVRASAKNKLSLKRKSYKGTLFESCEIEEEEEDKNNHENTEVSDNSQCIGDGQEEGEGQKSPTNSTSIFQNSPLRKEQQKRDLKRNINAFFLDKGFVDRPLQCNRAQRALERKPYYFAPKGKNIKNYSEVICKDIESYLEKLSGIQKLSIERLPWGNPIVVGRNNGTLDKVKKRFVNETYDIEDDQEGDETNSKSYGKRRHASNKSEVESESDNDIFDKKRPKRNIKGKKEDALSASEDDVQFLDDLEKRCVSLSKPKPVNSELVELNDSDEDFELSVSALRSVRRKQYNRKQDNACASTSVSQDNEAEMLSEKEEEKVKIVEESDSESIFGEDAAKPCAPNAKSPPSPEQKSSGPLPNKQSMSSVESTVPENAVPCESPNNLAKNVVSNSANISDEQQANLPSTSLGEKCRRDSTGSPNKAPQASSSRGPKEHIIPIIIEGNEDDLLEVKEDAKPRECSPDIVEEIDESTSVAEQSNEIACPICNKLFPAERIEAHASECDQFAADDGSSDIEEIDDKKPKDNNIICYICNTFLPEGPTYQDHVQKCLLRKQHLASQSLSTSISRRRPLHTYSTSKSKPVTIVDTTSDRTADLFDDLESCERQPVEALFNLSSVERSPFKTRGRTKYEKSSFGVGTSTSSLKFSSVQRLQANQSLSEAPLSPVKCYVPISSQKDSCINYHNQFPSARNGIQSNQSRGIKRKRTRSTKCKRSRAKKRKVVKKKTKVVKKEPKVVKMEPKVIKMEPKVVKMEPKVVKMGTKVVKMETKVIKKEFDD